MVRTETDNIFLKSLLQQEGIPLTDERSKPEVFIEQKNGQLILSSFQHPEINFTSKSARVKFITSDSENFFRNTSLVDINERCQIPNLASIGRTERGLPFVCYQDDMLILPFNLSRLLKHRGKQTKQFYAKQGRCPTEIVARTDRGGVRRIFANCLRQFLNRRNLPYIHLSYVPKNCRSLFGFRIDTDYSQIQLLTKCAKIARNLNMAWTWFIMTAGINGNFADLKNALSGQDIQVHCHRHTVFPDLKRNIRNYSIALNKLKLIGVAATGVAAPYGEWNEELDRAFAQLGFSFSSEFCYGYDDLPSRPIIHGQFSPILQIPVHPISIGRLVWAKMDESQMIEYYRNIIDLQVARGEPCFLYDHPEKIIKFSAVVKAIIEYGLNRCGNWITLTEFNNWWQRREKVKYQCRIENNCLELIVINGFPDVELIIEFENSIARIPLNSGKYPIDQLNWEPAEIVPCPVDLTKIRQPSLRTRFQNIIWTTQRKLRTLKENIYLK